MKHNVIIIFVLLLFKFVQTSGSKIVHNVKLESSKVTYVNKAFVDFESGVIPFNKTVNFLNQSMKFKFPVVGNIFSDVSTYRVTKTNRSFLFGQLTLSLKDAITMDKFGVGALYTEYTHPPLYWPPQQNVLYHTFGWAPDSKNFPNNVPAGDIKILVHLRLQNLTRLYEVEWVLRISY